MTTPLFLLRALQLGLHLQDLELMTIGAVNDMAIERANDDCAYDEIAGQADFDAF